MISKQHERLSYVVLLIIWLVMNLYGCHSKVDKPQPTAIAFLNKMYIKQDLKEAYEHTGGQLKKRLDSTPNLRTVQMYVMGIHMEKVEKIRYMGADMDFFQLKSENVKIVYQLVGIKNGIKFKDHITMRMDYDYEESKWKVTQIIPDKFNMNR